MNSADMATLIPDPDDLLKLSQEQQCKHLLELLAKQHTSQQTAVSHSNFFSRAHDSISSPKYGSKQSEVDEALRAAWTLLESKALLTKSASSAGNWVYVGKVGMEYLMGNVLPTTSTSVSRKPGDRIPGSLDELERDIAHWVGQLDPNCTEPGSLRERAINNRLRRLEYQKKLLLDAEHQISTSSNGLPFIAHSRLNELRALTSPQFDFRKLIRMCEELNIASREESHFATAMLTRGVLDHVPPVFGLKKFSEVANNYIDGTKSFKETMQHLDTAARKVADQHLHTPIRKSETLPVAQQVNFASQLDVLLSEIIRITR